MVSMESVLRTWEQKEPAQVDDMVLQMALRQAEIRSWFFGAELEDIKWMNVAEWLTEYFFEGRTPSDVSAAELEELRQMVDHLAVWVGLPSRSFGAEHLRSPDVSCMRLTRDPLVAASRPLWIYAITTLLLPSIAHQRCRWMGFSKFVSGGLEYWHRPAQQGERTQPIVFCHGLGVGVLPYLDLVGDICSAVGSEIFLLDMPHLSSRPKTDVPSPRETVACIVDMLAAWGHASAHFVGHSFGTVVITWVLRRSEMATSAVLLDPVCFLLMKHDVLSNVLYSSFFQPLSDFRSAAFQFFVFQELYTAHALSRNFFWQDNDLTAEKLQRPAVVLLSGADTIVPAHSVRRLLECEKRRRQQLLVSDKLAREGGSMVRQRSAGNGMRRQTSDPAAPAHEIENCEDSQPVEVKALGTNGESSRRTASTPLDVVWRPNAAHSDCWETKDGRLAVVQGLLRIIATSEGRTALPDPVKPR